MHDIIHKAQQNWRAQFLNGEKYKGNISICARSIIHTFSVLLPCNIIHEIGDKNNK